MQDALELVFRRAGHKNAIVRFAPGDEKAAARQIHADRSPRSAGSRRANGCRTSARAAGLRDARAPFPNAQTQGVWAQDLCERDVGALGEKLVVFQRGAKGIEAVASGILNPEDAMRIS